MNLLARWIQFAAFLFGVTFSSASSADIEQDALNLIANFADRMCTKIPLEGSEGNRELSGEAQAELSSFMKYLADIGVEGAVDYKEASYQGLIREDIVNALTASTNCKLKIWDDLKKRVLVGGSIDSLDAAFQDPREGITLSEDQIHTIIDGTVELVVKQVGQSAYSDRTPYVRVAIRPPIGRPYGFKGEKGKSFTFEYRNTDYQVRVLDIDFWEQNAILQVLSK